MMKSSIEPDLYTNIRKHFIEFVNLLHLNEEKFCITAREIRGYKELCLKAVWGSGTISEIILGPMCIQDKKELRQFLKLNGLEGTKISVSKVAIR